MPGSAAAASVVEHPIVIVGAGAAGLAVAARLGRQRTPYRLLESSPTIGTAWRERYDSLHLHTARSLSGLPGVPIPRRHGPWVARDDLVRYLEAYAAQLGVRPEFGVEVGRVDPDGDHWHLETSTGPVQARAVVIATGQTRTPHLPDWPGVDTFPGPVRHSSAYREPSAYAGRDVLVVGSGNSATEIAVELAGTAARVRISIRTPPNLVRRAVLGVPSQFFGIALAQAPEGLGNVATTVLRRATVGDLTAYGLPAPKAGFSQFFRTATVPILDAGFVAAVRGRRITVVPEVVGFAAADVRLGDGSVIAPDAVIAATGYRFGLEPLVGHLGVLGATGRPQTSGAALPEHPGLRFVGFGIELAGQLRAINREARAVARSLRV